MEEQHSRSEQGTTSNTSAVSCEYQAAAEARQSDERQLSKDPGYLDARDGTVASTTCTGQD